MSKRHWRYQELSTQNMFLFSPTHSRRTHQYLLTNALRQYEIWRTALRYLSAAVRRYRRYRLVDNKYRLFWKVLYTRRYSFLGTALQDRNISTRSVVHPSAKLDYHSFTKVELFSYLPGCAYLCSTLSSNLHLYSFSAVYARWNQFALTNSRYSTRQTPPVLVEHQGLLLNGPPRVSQVSSPISPLYRDRLINNSLKSPRLILRTIKRARLSRRLNRGVV